MINKVLPFRFKTELTKSSVTYLKRVSLIYSYDLLFTQLDYLEIMLQFF